MWTVLQGNSVESAIPLDDIRKLGCDWGCRQFSMDCDGVRSGHRIQMASL